MLSLCSCQKPADPWREKGSSDLSKEWSLVDFSKDFYSALDISTLKQKYPFFFSSSTPDSIWLAKKDDDFERALFTETQKVFADRKQLKAELNALFRRVKYFFLNFPLQMCILMFLKSIIFIRCSMTKVSSL